MCTGISLHWRELPDELILHHRLERLRRTRPPKGDVEYHFLFRIKPAILPVLVDGQFRILQWAGYCPRERLEAGDWIEQHPEPVSIPASFVCDGGVWYPIKDCIQGVLARRKIYLITRQADHYHKIMCGTERMVVEKMDSI